MSDCQIKVASMVNAMGSNIDEVLTSYLSGVSAGMQYSEGFLPNERCMLGKVNASLPVITGDLAVFNTRNNQLILAALAPIQTQIQTAIDQFGRDRVAVLMGTSTSGILEGEQAFAALKETGSFPDAYHYSQQEIGNPSVFLKRYLGLEHIAYTVSTACSSSGKIFSSAKQLLVEGLADAVIVGGADALCKLTVNGFAGLGATSLDACLPFSENRDGINIGEAAALFLLTKESGGIQLKGVGATSDAHHISAPDPTASGAIAAMRQAQDEAGLSADDIFYINLHGTATPHNDAMEAKAFNVVFGENTTTTYASSTKPLTGHTLGAAGATELGLCWALLQASGLREENTVHIMPQINDGHLDVAATPTGLLQEKIAVPKTGNVYMQSNSFAFGGSNCSVVLGRESDCG